MEATTFFVPETDCFRYYFLQAVQACRRNVAAGGDPCCLVGKADGSVAEGFDESQADNGPGNHLHNAGEKGSAGVTKPLGHHAGYI